MDAILEILILGVQRGAVFSLVGLGLALVYKATRILNFAQGELGTMPAFMALMLMVGFELDGSGAPNRSLLLPATVLAMVVGAALGVGVYLAIIRRLAHAGPATAVTSLVATAGVALLFLAVETNVFESRRRTFPRYVEGGFQMPVADYFVSYHTVVILAVLGLVAAVLAGFFRSPPGVALLATAQDPLAAELQGIPVERMRALAWGAAGALGGLAGVLGAGVGEGVSPFLITISFMIPAFVGVILGGITSMVGAVVGCFVLAVVQQSAVRLDITFDLGIPGAAELAVLLVLLGVLLLRPQGLLGRTA